MMDRAWDAFSDFMEYIGMPFVCFYFSFCNNTFLNVAADDAEWFEKAGNYALVPFQYFFVGETAHHIEGLEGVYYQLEPRFEYEKDFYLKTTASIIALPASLICGSLLKGIAYLSPRVRNRHKLLLSAKTTPYVQSNKEYYESLGLKMINMEDAEILAAPTHVRRPGDENTLMADKQALKDISDILKKYAIPFWLDCGTCLGAYRYGGNIPWDYDIDIAVLQPDFANIRQVLNELDKDKYEVQNWSARDKPNTYLKVFIKESRSLIDIYHFAIDEETKEVHYILSQEDHLFMPEWWKIRERRFCHPLPYDFIFPLKKAIFDGIEVYVPNRTKEYLQSKYGDNIEPAKIYNQETGMYEKDLTHPYWNRIYAH